MGVRGEFLGSVFFPEDEGLDVEVEGGRGRERRRGRRRERRGIKWMVMELNVEGATHNGA